MRGPPKWFSLSILVLALAAVVVVELDRNQDERALERAEDALIEEVERDLARESPQFGLSRCTGRAGRNERAVAACFRQYRRRLCELPSAAEPVIDPGPGLPTVPERTVEDSIEYLKELERREANCGR